MRSSMSFVLAIREYMHRHADVPLRGIHMFWNRMDKRVSKGLYNIRGILASAGILLQQKEARVVFEQKEPVWVWADEFKIEEVITNYLNNAMNHLDEERQITISIFREGDQVRITVFNTGQHIPEEDLDNLWTKFYKVDKARTREYGGSGIGLSIVKAIMDSHNKSCGVENVDGGVEFWFTVDSGV